MYELFVSLVGRQEGTYTYDLVTAAEWDIVGEAGNLEHDAVAITDGMSAQQSDAAAKLQHEAAFPLKLLDKGVGFTCLDSRQVMCG